MHSLAPNHRLNESLSQLRLCSSYSHRWSELLPPFSHRRNACRGEDEGKKCCCLPSSSSHSVPEQTFGLFPAVGTPFALNCAIQTLQKHNTNNPWWERVRRNAVSTGKLFSVHPCAQTSAFLSFSSSLFIPLSPPRLKSEPSSAIG